MTVILWAIDVPHIFGQKEARMQIKANPQNKIQELIVV